MAIKSETANERESHRYLRLLFPVLLCSLSSFRNTDPLGLGATENLCFFFFILTVCITSKSLDHYITVKNKKGN